jgi:hypothetical protein
MVTVVQEMEQLKQRKPLPAVVMGMGSPPEKIAAVMLDLAQKQRSVLAIRIEPETYAAVRKHAPGTTRAPRSQARRYGPQNTSARARYNPCASQHPNLPQHASPPHACHQQALWHSSACVCFMHA